MKRLELILIILAVAGMAVSGYALWQHYAPAGSSFCNINETVSCDRVNKSVYSEIGGVPVAGVGLGGYFILIWFLFVGYRWRELRPAAVRLAAGVAGIGLVFSFYLTYLEFSVLRAICPLCITSQFLILLITLGLLLLLLYERDSSN